MLDIELPTEDELAQLSCEFDWHYSESYLNFIRSPSAKVLEKLRDIIPDGWFVKSRADILEFVEAEMTGDELAIFFVKGTRDKMTEVSGYGAPRELAFYGFDLRQDLYPELQEAPVIVFSIHAIVAGWLSFPEFIDYVMEKTHWKDNAGWVVGKYGFLVRPNTLPHT